jgi:type I restriction enzyme, S subunit
MSRYILPTLPEEWTSIAVGKLARIVYGEPLRAEERTGKGGIPVYGSGGIVGEHDLALHTGPSIIIGRKGSVGAIYYVATPFWCIDTAFYLDDISPLVDAEYLANILDFIDLSQLAIVVGVPGISRKHVEEVQIPLPPLSEQKQIVRILREVDQLRCLRNDIYDKAQNLQFSVFREMFGESKTNPFGWSTSSLGALDPFVTSGSRGWADYYSETGAKFIRVQNLTGHHLSLKDVASINPPKTAESQRAKIQPRDILFSITGLVGLVAYVADEIGEAYVSQHVAIIRLRNDRVDPEFVSVLLADESGGQEQIRKTQYGQVKPGFGLNDIRALRVILPPIELQQEFARRVSEIRTVVGEQDNASLNVDRLKESLISYAFNGELTARWRASNEPRINEEALQRDHLLEQRKDLPRPLEEIKHIETKFLERIQLIRKLSRQQLQVLEIVHTLNANYPHHPGKEYFTAPDIDAGKQRTSGKVTEAIERRYNSEQTDAEEQEPPFLLRSDVSPSLHLLSEMGLIRRVRLAASPSGKEIMLFAPAYRLLAEDDDVRLKDLTTLEVEKV